MFRITRSLSSLNGLPRRPALTSRTRPAAILIHQPQQAILAPSIIQRAAFASKKGDKADPPPPKQPIDYEAERKIGERKLEARPSEVSVRSSTTNELKTPVENQAGGPVMQNELKHDMGIIKDTFSLENVPRESKILGLAGTIPYFATSLSTIYLGWDLKQSIPTGNVFYDAIAIDHGTAQHLLSIVEPVQLGYGAVIISFLGAIHWGLEYAEKKPSAERTRFRYGLGLIAPIVAWPTLIMPVPYALTTQFLAFVGLYFADARATTRGWAPSWYGSYRFMLTAMVGLALFVSLVGRQKMSQGNALTQEGLQARLEQTGQADHDTDWAKLEAEEKKRLKKEKAEAEKKAKKEAEKKEKEKKGKEGKGGNPDDKMDDKKKQENDKKENDEEDDSNERNDAEEAKKEQQDDDNDDDKKDESDGKEEDRNDGDNGQEDSKRGNKADSKGGDKKKGEDKKDGEKKDGEKKDDEKKDDEKNESQDNQDNGKGNDQKSKDQKQTEKADKESQSQKGTGK